MSINEWVRSIFGSGTKPATPWSKSDNKKSSDDYDNVPEGFTPFFGGSDNIDGEATQSKEFTFSRSGDVDDMFRHFDGMFRDFDEMFRSMGITELPASPDLPGSEGRPGSEWGSWRDLLKRPNSAEEKKDDMKKSPTFRHPSFFGSVWLPNHAPLEAKVDRDLDKEFEQGDLSKLIIPMEEAEMAVPAVPRAPGDPGRLFQSVRVHTKRGADGRTEERRTVEDADGNTETTVTRRIGDQVHTFTTKRSPEGSEELSETTVNLDKRDKENFERQWKQTSLPPWRGGAQPDSLVPGTQSSLDTNRDSIFYNLFGSSFKGFPSASDE